MSTAALAAAYKQAAKCAADAYIEVNKPLQIAEVALSGLIGTYSIVRQYDLQREYLKLAEEQVDQAERYLKLAEDNYNQIAVVSFECQKALFNRYQSQFAGREVDFLTCAFDKKEYTPDFATQRGRAIGDVSRAFSRAREQRRRNTGKYNTGRSCHDNTQLAIAQARAETAAVNNAYRFEEQRKFRFDQWFFQRMTAGVSMVSDMASRVVSGVNGGVAGANAALGGVGSALQVSNQSFGFVENGFTNQANFFGSLANASFSNLARGLGTIQTNQMLGGVGSFVPGLPQGIASSGGAGIDAMRAGSPMYRPASDYYIPQYPMGDGVSTGLSPSSATGVQGVGTAGYGGLSPTEVLMLGERG